MASIIEKEIAKREELIVKHNEEVVNVEALEKELIMRKAALAEFNKEVLEEEIAELKTYLPHNSEENVDQPVQHQEVYY